ncbi:hypothetical protein [Nostoc sp. C057]|uniref:hypothetical protein n=1 Tax=Nostoc sp. C057 TaxID=2576903 RepID=UPI0015C3B267|nr:hypothetical protein [Nostoc sp. C057]
MIWAKTRGLADGVQRADGKVPLIALLNMGVTNYGTHPSTQHLPVRRSMPSFSQGQPRTQGEGWVLV